MLQQHVDNLAAGGQDQSKAKVAIKDWVAMLRQNEIPLEMMETLLLTGWVATDGTYVFIKV